MFMPTQLKSLYWNKFTVINKSGNLTLGYSCIGIILNGFKDIISSPLYNSFKILQLLPMPFDGAISQSPMAIGTLLPGYITSLTPLART